MGPRRGRSAADGAFPPRRPGLRPGVEGLAGQVAEPLGALLLGVLAMLAGRYPSDELADLRPRVSWDRARDVVVGRRDARLIALVNGGTIPERCLLYTFPSPPDRTRFRMPSSA